ncbi:hypothetical protein [Novosphingopyxis sp.]|uniref:hypothetical protein n=1 Tax=Novosphingopyxis sp. TaxID=2709690 RepID=UPI003B5A7C06
MRHFTSNEVCAVTGASLKVLAAWLKRGHFQPLAGQPGSGRRGTYEMPDVVQLAFLRELSRVGIGPHISAQVWRDAVVPNSGELSFRLLFGLLDDDTAVDWRIVWPGEDDGLGQANAPAVAALVNMPQLIARIARGMEAVVKARDALAVERIAA